MQWHPCVLQFLFFSPWPLYLFCFVWVFLVTCHLDPCPSAALRRKANLGNRYNYLTAAPRLTFRRRLCYTSVYFDWSLIKLTDGGGKIWLGDVSMMGAKILSNEAIEWGVSGKRRGGNTVWARRQRLKLEVWEIEKKHCRVGKEKEKSERSIQVRDKLIYNWVNLIQSIN